MIALQCCVSFWKTKWISYMYVCVCVYIYISPLCLGTPCPHPTHLGHHRALSWAPCAILQNPTGYLFYTLYCIYIKPNPPIHPTLLFPPHVHSLCVGFYSCPSNRFICTIFSTFHTHALIYDICFSLSDLLHSVWQALGSFTSLQMTWFCSF